MASDQEIAKGVEAVLRESDPNAVTSLNSVVQQLEAKLGFNLSHKADFIRDQITFLLRSHPVPKDHFAPQPHPHYPNIPLPPSFLHPHFALQQQISPAYPPPQAQVQHPQPPPPVTTTKEQDAAGNVPETPKGRPPAGTKRRGCSGGLNKVCGVSPKLQAIVGEPALPRTESLYRLQNAIRKKLSVQIVKQLWAYIRKHNLQDPGNKRKIICDDALRLVFETDCTDMFKMNKLLAKHILPLNPTQQTVQTKKSKVEDESTVQNPDPNLLRVVISDALAKFYGTEEREMLQSEALGRLWEYIKVNQLEDPASSMVIHCDAKLQELLGCQSISALGIQEMLVRHHLMKQ